MLLCRRDAALATEEFNLACVTHSFANYVRRNELYAISRGETFQILECISLTLTYRDGYSLA